MATTVAHSASYYIGPVETTKLATGVTKKKLALLSDYSVDYENVCFPIIIFFIVKIITVQGEWKNERKSKVPFHALNGIKGACPVISIVSTAVSNRLLSFAKSSKSETFDSNTIFVLEHDCFVRTHSVLIAI